jgi:putative transposase
MPRSARIVIPDFPHHITQRGNRREDVFLDDPDRETYIEILRKQCNRFGLAIHGWCLMSNHVHLVATPSTEDSMAKAVGRAHHLYSKVFNSKYGKVGHVWHSRFYSNPLDELHFVNALVYVDRNPVRAGLVEKPWDWLWSSASMHVRGVDPMDVVDLDWWRAFEGKRDWKSRIANELSRDEIDVLRRHTQSGRPLGSDSFVKKIEKMLGYPVKLKPVGRPRKFSS